MKVKIDWGPSYGFVVLHDEIEENLRAFAERFPPARADERKAAIDAVLRRNIGRELASACWWAWLYGCEQYEPRSFLFRVQL